MNSPVVATRISPEELEQLDRLVAESGQRRGDLLRLAIAEWLRAQREAQES